jgi:hypothetical protein
MSPTVTKSNKKIHEWESFKMLYIAGFDVSEICEMPEFQATKLAASYAHVHVARMGWKVARDKVKKAAEAGAISGLRDRIAKVREKFNRLYISQIESEMLAVEGQLKLPGSPAQLARLDVLEKLRKVATPVLGLDETEGDPNVKGFRTIYNIQVNGNLQNLPTPQRDADLPPSTPIDIEVSKIPSLKLLNAPVTALQRIKKIKTKRYRNDNPNLDVSPTENILKALELGKKKKLNEAKISRKKSNGQRILQPPGTKSA